MSILAPRNQLSLGRALVTLFSSLALAILLGLITLEGRTEAETGTLESAVTSPQSHSNRHVRSSGDSHWSAWWDQGDKRFRMELRGEADFSADDRQLLSLKPGGSFVLELEGVSPSRRLRVGSDSEGQLEFEYRVGGDLRPFQPEGEQWLAEVLPDVLRASGIAAQARVRRILAGEGVEGVLAEVRRIPFDGVQTRYLLLLADAKELDSSELERLLQVAGREVGSDGELARLLIKLTPDYRRNPEALPAVLEALENVESDGDRARVLLALIREANAVSHVAELLLKATQPIRSDGDKARVLIGFIRDGVETVPQDFFEVAGGIGSDGDLARVLVTLLRSNGSVDAATSTVGVARQIGSDGDLARVLIASLSVQPVDHLGEAFFDACREISSDGDLSRVLMAGIRTQPGHEAMLGLLEVLEEVGSDGDRARVLVQAARSVRGNPELERAYMELAEGLENEDKRRVMRALGR